jgi:hypothetical protein
MIGRFNTISKETPTDRTVFMCRIPAGEPTGKKSRRWGVRASIVATKPGNAGGAKGRRKMDE